MARASTATRDARGSSPYTKLPLIDRAVLGCQCGHVGARTGGFVFFGPMADSERTDPDNTGQFRWTKKRFLAPLLLAEDEVSDAGIVQRVGIARSTRLVWKVQPEFATEVGDSIGQLQAAMLPYRVAKKRGRLTVLDELHTTQLPVVEERAEAMAGEAPGAGTGLLVRQTTFVGSGPFARTVKEYAVDTGLTAEIRAIHKQAAQVSIPTHS